MSMLAGALGGLGKGMREVGLIGLEEKKIALEEKRKEAMLRLGIELKEGSDIRVLEKSSELRKGETVHAATIASDTEEKQWERDKERFSTKLDQAKQLKTADLSAVLEFSLTNKDDLEKVARHKVELERTLAEEGVAATLKQAKKLGLSSSFDINNMIYQLTTGAPRPQPQKSVGGTEPKSMSVKESFEIYQSILDRHVAEITAERPGLWSLKKPKSSEEIRVEAVKRANEEFYTISKFSQADGESEMVNSLKVIEVIRRRVSEGKRDNKNPQEIRELVEKDIPAYYHDQARVMLDSLLKPPKEQAVTVQDEKRNYLSDQELPAHWRRLNTGGW